ncbi:MAG: hypothetical protein U9R60_05750, partial [Bacteroidota bacterium]|nr:hypothetical protein [Bacteroidota bacterium]
FCCSIDVYAFYLQLFNRRLSKVYVNKDIAHLFHANRWILIGNNNLRAMVTVTPDKEYGNKKG